MVRKVIEKNYRGTFVNYGELKRDGRDDVRNEWFNEFKVRQDISFLGV